MYLKLLTSRMLLILLAILSQTVSAQEPGAAAERVLKEDQNIREFHINRVLNTASYILLKDQSVIRQTEIPLALKKWFSKSPLSEFRLSRTVELKNNISVQLYHEFFRGIKVDHAAYNVILKNNKPVSITAESYPLPAGFSTSAGITAEVAKNKALQFVNAKKYAWELIDEEIAKNAGNASVAQQLIAVKAEYTASPELVIAKDLYGNGLARLAYKFNVYAVEPLSRNWIYIDAEDGRLLLVNPIIKHTGDPAKKSKNTDRKVADNPVLNSYIYQQNYYGSTRATASELGTATTRYAGTREIYTTRVSVPLTGTPDPNNPSVQLAYSGVDPRIPVVGPIDVFILKDDTRGGGIMTFDMNGVGGLPLSIPALQTTALAFVDKDNNWKNEALPGTNEDHIRGATSDGSVGADEASNDDYALDAHWGAEMVYDYWKSRHNRLSFDNNDGAIRSYVHYGPAYDNAFWNGSVMTYGDGSGTSAAGGFRPLTSLDVCGHEIGHGVCSYTSDLVYASESGAMNEGLSDIWAAAVERYVNTNVDPTLPFQYWQVGEQIAADNIGLRRMDNPKAKSDPDTYGGRFWVNPVCTPTLANDQCGVHSNSGVLNKWFYLLVQGPGTTTGLPVPYTDDGIADGGTTVAEENLGNNYGALGPSGTGEFIGLGFDQAEAITYLMELTLTPNATFAEARIASINAARALYGECSQAEKTVTDAWFAVNVGASYAGCAAPLLSTELVLTTVNESAEGDCPRYREYQLRTNLTTAQGAPVTVNFSRTGGTLGDHEFELMQSSVVYNTGESGLRTVNLRIFDDAMVEGTESLEITASSSSPPMNDVFTLTINDDDIIPSIGSSVTLLSEDFESTPVTTIPTGWTKIDRITPSPVKWEVETQQTGSPLTWSGKRAIIEIVATSPTSDGLAVYDQLAEAQTILRTPLIDATGLNNVRVQFVYSAGGEPACDPACDYGQLLFSYDGVNFYPFTAEDAPMYAQLTDANFDYILPGSFNGKQFYLGIIWVNDGNAGVTASITIDDFTVTALGTSIEERLNASIAEPLPGETGKPSYFYSSDLDAVITKVVNSVAHDYGCVTTTIEKAGNSTFVWYTDGTNLHRAADKIVRVSAANNGTGNAYSIDLFFTEAQIVALENFAGVTRNEFFLYHTTGAGYGDASGTNTIRVAATHTAIAGVGGVFSGSFTDAITGSFALGAPLAQAPLPVNCIDFKALKSGNAVMLQWNVSDERNNSRFEIERSTDGRNYSVVGTVQSDPARNGQYSYSDNGLSGLKHVYYRLRQFDANGESKYICTILKLELDRNNIFTIGRIHPNPTMDAVFVNVSTDKTRKLRLEYVNSLGQVINWHDELISAGTSRVALRIKTISSGTYMIRFKDEEGRVLDAQTFIKN